MNKDFYTIATTNGMSKTPISSILKTPKGAMDCTPETEKQQVRFSTASTRMFSIVPKASSLLSFSEVIREIETEDEKSIGKEQESDRHEYYEVEKIIKHREFQTEKRDKEHEYLIKWKGYPKNQSSWVKKKDMKCERLLAEYHEQLQGKQKERNLRKAKRKESKKK